MFISIDVHCLSNKKLPTKYNNHGTLSIYPKYIVNWDGQMIQTLCLIPFLFNIKQSHARIGTTDLLSTKLPCYQLSCTVGYIFFLCYFKNAQQLYWDSIQAIKKVNQFCGATKQLIKY